MPGFTTQVLSNIDAGDTRAVSLLRAILASATPDVIQTLVQQLAGYAEQQERVDAAVRVALQVLAPLLQHQHQLARSVPLQQLWSVMCKAREQHSRAVPGYVGWGASCFISTSRALAQAGLAGPLVDLGCHEVLAQMMVGGNQVLVAWPDLLMFAYMLHRCQTAMVPSRQSNDLACCEPAVRSCNHRVTALQAHAACAVLLCVPRLVAGASRV